MCAPHRLDMEDGSVSRFNSQSTGRTTLVGSEHVVSPIPSAMPLVDGKLQLMSPIIQTEDNKQWIDLDLIDPKLLRELRRRYDLTAESKNSLVKSAAKIKAWTRQTKLGFDIRLRRKINAEQDEVTDFSLVRDPWPAPDEKSMPMEMPSNAVFELPDTSTALELPADPIVQPRPTLFETRQIEDALPKYEPREGQANGDGQGSTESSLGNVDRPPSPSIASIVSTPIRGLSLRDGQPEDEDAKDLPVSPSETIPDHARALEGLEANLQETREELEKEHQAREKLEELLITLKSEVSRQNSQKEAPKNPFDGLQVARAVQYETETDVEPASPSQRRQVRAGLRKNLSSQRKRKTKSPLLQSQTPGGDNVGEEVEASSSDLARRLTRTEKVPASAGGEAIWVAILQSQGKILGAEHPLVFKAKYTYALSRVKEHQNCPPTILAALRESKAVAVRTLGQHPLVATFSANLDTLESVIVDPSASLSEDMTDDVEEHAVTSYNAVKSTEENVPDQSRTQDQLNSVDESSLAPNDGKATPSGSAHQEAPSLPKIRTDIDSSAAEVKNSPTHTLPQASQDALYNTYSTPHQPRNSARVIGGLVFEAVTSVALNSILWLQRNYGPEPTVEPGKVRVRWTCSCGERLYDDYTEKRRGAARELEAYLNRPRAHTGGSSPTTPSSNGNHSFNSSVGFPPSTHTSWSSYNQSFQGGSDSKRPQHTSSLPLYSTWDPTREPPWLLTCANEERFTPKVAHIDMGPFRVKSDKDLAMSLREHYFHINRRWWHALKLRGLSTIEFVQFECHRNRFADIRKCPDMPPAGTADYDFRPADLVPPVGSAYLLHLFRHPEDYDDELITYLRAPKRTARLNGGVGWGINLVEGFVAARVWMLINLIFGFVSLAFGIAWACERHDIQGAFGVAQWVSALAVLAAGWVQACIS